MKLKEQLKDIPVYQPGKSIEEVKKEYGLNRILKLASNENLLGSSKKVKERLGAELSNLNYYPDGHGRELRQKIALLHGIKEDQIILGNGSDEIIHYLSRAYLNEFTNIITANPTFPMYKFNALAEGAKIIEIPLVQGKHDLNNIALAIDDHTAMIWICNPNNPTGTIVTEDELKGFLERVPTHILVIIDEAYAEYVMDEEYPNTLRMMETYPNLLVLRTFSKIYGLAALRIGYGIGYHETIKDLLKVKEPFNANHIAQIAATEAFCDQEYVEFCKIENHASKQLFINGLEEIGLHYYHSETNFILFSHPLNDDDIFEEFLRDGIIVRPGNKLGIPGTVRITIGTREQMKLVLRTLKRIMI